MESNKYIQSQVQSLISWSILQVPKITEFIDLHVHVSVLSVVFYCNYYTMSCSLLEKDFCKRSNISVIGWGTCKYPKIISVWFVAISKLHIFGFGHFINNHDNKKTRCWLKSLKMSRKSKVFLWWLGVQFPVNSKDCTLNTGFCMIHVIIVKFHAIIAF